MTAYKFKQKRVRSKRHLIMESLERREVFAGLPLGATTLDTGEYMLGRIAVTPVLLESNGVTDASSENWTESHVDEVSAKIDTALDWWKDVLATKSSVHELDFVLDNTYVDSPVPTKYEPISRVSNDYTLWVAEFLGARGFNRFADLQSNMRDFNNSQRLKYDADWAFTIFVVNSQSDADGQFRPGGTFNRAFSFAGGLFMVVPSMRPASTFTHEVGHQFWARDEYDGSGTFQQRRGYYNAQNTNAISGNPDPNFQQQPSIMSAGEALNQAYNSKQTAPQALAMMGWQDSDGDGIFDVLDVPMELTGEGRYDATAGVYRFLGNARAVAMPNANSSGLQNDITLNRISRIEYSFDGTTWVTAASPGTQVAIVDVSINVPQSNSGTIRIRAIDAKTGVTSNLHVDDLNATPGAVVNSGIAGYVWLDKNKDQTWQTSEAGRANWQVRLVDNAGQPVTLQKSIEPDANPVGRIAADAYAGVTLSVVGDDADGLGVFTDSKASTGTKVFRPFSVFRQDYDETWSRDYQLKIDFASPTSFVSVDVIGAGPDSYGRLELYDAAGKLLERVTSGKLTDGQIQKLSIGRKSADVHWAIVRSHMNTLIRIDNLKYGPLTETRTTSSGLFSLPSLPAGTYNVQAIPLHSGTQFVSPASGILQSVALGQAPVSNANFAVFAATSEWQNQIQREDVDNSGSVTPRDVLLVISRINQRGSGPLTGLTSPPFVDTDGNGILAPVDALIIISFINARSGGSGEGEGDESGPGDLSAPARSVDDFWVNWDVDAEFGKKSKRLGSIR